MSADVTNHLFVEGTPREVARLRRTLLDERGEFRGHSSRIHSTRIVSDNPAEMSQPQQVRVDAAVAGRYLHLAFESDRGEHVALHERLVGYDLASTIIWYDANYDAGSIDGDDTDYGTAYAEAWGEADEAA